MGEIGTGHGHQVKSCAECNECAGKDGQHDERMQGNTGFGHTGFFHQFGNFGRFVQSGHCRRACLTSGQTILLRE